MKITDIFVEETLLENKNTYKQMIASLMTLLQQYDKNAATSLQQEAEMIRKTYGRADRIIWALRHLRLSYLVEFTKQLDTLVDDERVKSNVMKITNKWMAEIIKNNPKGYSSDKDVMAAVKRFSSSNFTHVMSHWSSYWDKNTDNYIEKIDRIEFGWQHPDDIWDGFTQIENEWKETREREIDHADDMYGGAEELIDFGDGFSWWNTGQPHCDKEGNSMGHCGNNSGMQSYDDELLSLRQEVKRGDQLRHIPYLTFIRDEDGNLGEMKGRANEKPAKKYHKYIVALLKSKHINGIKGGGYLPETNFSISDLDDETRDQLVAAKPSLESFIDKYRRDGFTPETAAELELELSSRGFPKIHSFNEDSDEIVLVEYDDLVSMRYDSVWEVLSNLISFIDDDDDEVDYKEIADDMDLNEDNVLRVLEYLPDDHFNRIADDVGLRGDFRDYGFRAKVAEAAIRGRYEEEIRMAIAHGSNPTRLRDNPDFKKYIDLVLDTYIHANSNYHLFHMVVGELPDAKIQIAMRVDNVVELLMADEYDDLVNVADDVKYSGHWFPGGDDSSYINDRANDEWNSQYSSMSDDDLKLKQKFSALENTSDTSSSDPQVAADWLRKHMDWNESEEADELANVLAEMKRRAGI